MGNMTDVNKEAEKNTLTNVENCHIVLIIYRPGGYLISSLSVQKCLGIFEYSQFPFVFPGTKIQKPM